MTDWGGNITTHMKLKKKAICPNIYKVKLSKSDTNMAKRQEQTIHRKRYIKGSQT